jgi:hypothetical protein
LAAIRQWNEALGFTFNATTGTLEAIEQYYLAAEIWESLRGITSLYLVQELGATSYVDNPSNRQKSPGMEFEVPKR